ncbi:hypothetical protein ABVT39_013306 [Epinephelus coioides]
MCLFTNEGRTRGYYSTGLDVFSVTERDHTYNKNRELGGHKVLTEVQADTSAECGGVSRQALISDALRILSPFYSEWLSLMLECPLVDTTYNNHILTEVLAMHKPV